MTQDRLELDEPSKAVLREARGLLRSKERRADQGRFLVEGRQAVREALRRAGVSAVPLRPLGQRPRTWI
jgi:TrmH family RNA methyltransferase